MGRDSGAGFSRQRAEGRGLPSRKSAAWLILAGGRLGYITFGGITIASDDDRFSSS